MHKLSFLRGLSLLAGVGVSLAATNASADVELANVVTIDFSAFDGTGFAPEPAAGQLDSDDWSIILEPDSMLDFGGTAGGAGSDYARGLSGAGAKTNGIWAFDVDGAGLIGLGVQPTADIFTPGQMTLRVVNNTGADITEFQVEYTVWINNDTGRSNSIALAVSADNMTYTPVGDPIVSVEAADNMNAFVGTDTVHVVTPAAPIADGAQFHIAWVGDDVAGTGLGRDEFAIEGITIRLLDVCGNGLTEEGEECDNGLDNADNAECLSTCVAATCGDGFLLEGDDGGEDTGGSESGSESGSGSGSESGSESGTGGGAGGEECDDGNTDPGDGCDATCLIEPEPPATTSGGTDSASGTDSADTSGSASDSATGASATGASATGATAGTDNGESEGSGSGQDDESSGCSCNSAGDTTAPIWSVLGFVGLGLMRRRRR